MRFGRPFGFAVGIFALGALFCADAVGQPSQFSMDYVQKAYVAYYGRPADPPGQAYWAGRMDNAGGSLAAIIDAFGNSTEFTQRYGGLTFTTLVTKIYRQALGRDPDSAGLAYYVGELQAGRRTLQSITLDVLNGASTAPDSTVVADKLAVAAYFTSKVAAGCDYGGEQTGVSALTPVTFDPATVTAAEAAIDSRCGGGAVVADDTQIDVGAVSAPPPMSIMPERPMSGSNVRVTVTAPGALSIGVVVAGGGCGTLTGSTVGTGVWLRNGTAADSGYCDLTASATYPGNVTKVLAGHFEVQASNPVLPPVSPDGGVYLLRSFPVASAPGAGPSITAIDGPPGFVNGGSATYTIKYTGPQTATSALIRVAGFEGYYRVPVTSSNGMVSLNLSFASDYFATTTTTTTATSARPAVMRSAMAQKAAMRSAATAAEQLNLQFSLEDALGSISGASSLNLNPAQVNAGEVKVSIAWDTPTDVDLWVTEPSGETIGYFNPTSATGGQLDLDSNPACQLDYINNENIYWPAGKSPNGVFQVNVNMFESLCGDPPGPAGASGTLTMTYCGADSPKIVPFTLVSENDSKLFTFTSQCGLRVSGSVKFEDFPVTDTGLGASAMVPVRYAKVQVVRSNGTPAQDVVIATGDTNALGKFDITFTNDTPQVPGFYVRVLAQQDNATLRQVVRNLNGDIYAFRTPKENEPLLDSSNPPADGEGFKVDMAVNQNDGAGALNIFDVGIDSSQYASSQTGRQPPMLTFKWTDGQRPEGNNVSYYSAPSTIFVNGDPIKRREYDDVVIAHEYGHFVMSRYSTDNSPGGSHGFDSRVTPTLAWSEGWATFFALASQKRTSYIATSPTGVGIFIPIETLPASVPVGNGGSVIGGNLSEAIVAGVLLDLFDSTNETNDTLSDKSTAIWGVLTKYLVNGYAKFADRGATGRDLVDFLDGWFCLGYGDKGADDTTGMRGIVKTLHGLSYDFANLASCK